MNDNEPISDVYVRYGDIALLLEQTGVVFLFNGPNYMAGLIVDIINPEALDGYASVVKGSDGKLSIVMESPHE